MTWDSSFELYPGPGDQGAVMSSVLRNIKIAVRERMELQHYWDEGDSPECTHLAGLCTVVNIAETPIALNVVGAMAFDSDGGILYRDRGSGLGFETIGGIDHGSLLNLSDGSCHTQYVLCTGDTPTVTSVTVLTGNTITGLRTNETGYNDEDVMPIGLHIGEDVSGGSKHSNDVVTGLGGVSLTCYDKIKGSIVEDGPVAIAGHTTRQWLIGEMAFIPLSSSDMTNIFSIHPLFSLSPPDDWIAGFTFYNASSSSRTFHMTAGIIDE